MDNPNILNSSSTRGQSWHSVSAKQPELIPPKQWGTLPLTDVHPLNIPVPAIHEPQGPLRRKGRLKNTVYWFIVGEKHCTMADNLGLISLSEQNPGSGSRSNRSISPDSASPTNHESSIQLLLTWIWLTSHSKHTALHECMRIVFLAEPKVVRSHRLELGAGLLDHHHPQNYYKTWCAPLGHFGAHQGGQNGGHGRCSYLRGLVVDGWHATTQCNRLALLLHPLGLFGLGVKV
jgi:hypothetical protein